MKMNVASVDRNEDCLPSFQFNFGMLKSFLKSMGRNERVGFGLT